MMTEAQRLFPIFVIIGGGLLVVIMKLEIQKMIDEAIRKKRWRR